MYGYTKNLGALGRRPLRSAAGPQKLVPPPRGLSHGIGHSTSNGMNRGRVPHGAGPRGGIADAVKARQSRTWVNMPDLTAVCQTVRAHVRRTAGQIGPGLPV